MGRMYPEGTVLMRAVSMRGPADGRGWVDDGTARTDCEGRVPDGMTPGAVFAALSRVCSLMDARRRAAELAWETLRKVPLDGGRLAVGTTLESVDEEGSRRSVALPEGTSAGDVGWRFELDTGFRIDSMEGWEDSDLAEAIVNEGWDDE